MLLVSEEKLRKLISNIITRRWLTPDTIKEEIEKIIEECKKS